MSTRVLLFDDTTSPLDLVALLPSGYPCRVASDHDQLQEQLDSFAPDVCLLNFACPLVTLSDIELIRHEKRWQGIPLVGVGLGTPEDTRIQAFRMGIDDFLDDLTSADELTWKIRRWAQFFRTNELGATVTELLDVLRDDEISPFGALVHATTVLKNVPEFGDHEQLALWLNGIELLSDDMARRIDLLRDYLRCREGERAFTPINCGLGAALMPQVDIWREHASIKNIDIVISDDVMIHEVHADFPSLKRILRWVGINACEHARSRVSVNATNEYGIVQIDITDDGDGFTPAEAEQAFCGFQVGSRLNLPYQLGLHLSLAREMLRFQDGLIELASPGPGNTTVRIVLPSA